MLQHTQYLALTINLTEWGESGFHIFPTYPTSLLTWRICCLCSCARATPLAHVNFLVRLCSSWTWYDYDLIWTPDTQHPVVDDHFPHICPNSNGHFDVSQVWQPHFSSEVVWLHLYASAHGPPAASQGVLRARPPGPKACRQDCDSRQVPRLPSVDTY